jgi:phosphoribosylformimino-5-aminoimidazole carboxamide ribotide isomerase
MDLYPAIDLRAGRAVRLRQGDFAQETVYGDDPIAIAEAFAADGAQWIHVVDLDAARAGNPVNRPLIAAIADAVTGRAHVQAGGGVRTVADAEALAAAGVSRVVIGSAALRTPTVVAEAAAVVPVAVGLDHRDGDLAVHGWSEGSGRRLLDALDDFPHVDAFVVTDIARDGTLAGPDLAGLADVVAKTSVPVIASGGVASLADLVSLRDVAGLAGVIVGKAIYEARFGVAEALAVVEAPR